VTAPALLLDIRRRFCAAADPRRAPDMQAYMKSAMPFHGVPTPLRRQITATAWQQHAPADATAWRAQVASLWDSATHREERYAALDWCRLAWRPRQRGAARYAFHNLDALPLFERMIVHGAWWDLVDEIAGHQLGVLLRLHPGPMAAVLRTWAHDGNIWKRRAAVISQLDLKEETDTELLTDCLEPSLLPSPFAREFFIAKAIGWALRQYARTDPDWVQRYLRMHQDVLPALSRREAGKHLDQSGVPCPRCPASSSPTALPTS
jgi:3-methyladenine DNA glycosylase AlkD